VAGSNQFSIESSNNFERSFKKLAKNYRADFVETITDVLEALIDDPDPRNARQEPLPGNLRLPEDWTFRKLEIKFGKGASGQVRLMYLVNESTFTIRLVWLYTHEQFAKRPADRDLRRVVQDILGDGGEAG
jgi:mRNA-degrading endonuclease YafQ of YafQ-DinJ toxin-antitoxin module